MPRPWREAQLNVRIGTAAFGPPPKATVRGSGIYVSLRRPFTARSAQPCKPPMIRLIDGWRPGEPLCTPYTGVRIRSEWGRSHYFSDANLQSGPRERALATPSFFKILSLGNPGVPIEITSLPSEANDCKVRIVPDAAHASDLYVCLGHIEEERGHSF